MSLQPNSRMPILMASFAAILLSGCVKKSTHQRTLEEFSQARADHQVMLAEMEAQLQARDRAAEERPRRHHVGPDRG